MRSFAAPLALAADVVCVLAFVVIGKIDHDTGTAVAAVAGIAWPFVVGLLLGWVVTLAWRNPFRVWPVGAFVWAITVTGGMTLRLFTGENAPWSFVTVTALFLAATMLGWRVVTLALTKRRQRVS